MISAPKMRIKAGENSLPIMLFQLQEPTNEPDEGAVLKHEHFDPNSSVQTWCEALEADLASLARQQRSAITLMSILHALQA